jgi:hypothetical protein
MLLPPGDLGVVGTDFAFSILDRTKAPTSSCDISRSSPVSVRIVYDFGASIATTQSICCYFKLQIWRRQQQIDVDNGSVQIGVVLWLRKQCDSEISPQDSRQNGAGWRVCEPV